MDEQGPVGTSVADGIAALSKQLVDDDFLAEPGCFFIFGGQKQCQFYMT